VRPEVSILLQVSAAHLLLRTGPALGAGYEQSSVAMLAALLMASGEELERGAARRVEENEALRALFHTGARVVDDAPLRERLEAAAKTVDSDLRISALEQTNGQLRGLLIDLHVHVEGLESDAARDLDAEIWRELVASTERRKLSLGAF